MLVFRFDLAQKSSVREEMGEPHAALGGSAGAGDAAGMPACLHACTRLNNECVAAFELGPAF